MPTKHRLIGWSRRWPHHKPTSTFTVGRNPRPHFLHRLVHSESHAHEDIVNCVTFLSPEIFATGSEESLYTRNVTAPVLKLFRGHARLMIPGRNIEHDEGSNRLFTIGGCDEVLSWDLGSITEAVSDNCEVVMRIPQICGLRLAPNGSKLLVTTQHSCLIVINNFHGLTIVEDLHNSDRVMEKIGRSFEFHGNSTNAMDVLQRDE